MTSLPQFTVHTAALDDSRPLLELVPDGVSPIAWVTDGEGFVAWGDALRVDPGKGDDRFARAENALGVIAAQAHVDDALGIACGGLVAFASFTFDKQSPGSVLLIPRVIVGRRAGQTWLTRIDSGDGTVAPDPHTGPLPVPSLERPRYAGASLPDVRWLEAVAAAVERISAGEFAKVVLARDFALWSRAPFDPMTIARRLAARFSSCHTFVLDGLVGATPETLIRRTGSTITSRVLAGTTSRDDDALRDTALGDALLRSSKDRLEHRYAVDSVRDVLRGVCRDLDVPATPALLHLRNVQHLVTDITGTLTGDTSALALAGALHPTAAVGGTPREAALAAIRTLEGMDRQRYAGPVGWVDPSGDGEFGIALRCAHIDGTRARLFAGVGIVEGSLPEAELEETRIKLLAMQQVLGAPT